MIWRVSLQMQRAQADVEQYRALTHKYARQIRAANEKAINFVQVTSREKAGKQSTPAELMEAIRAVADVVDGIWIHVDNGQEAFATEMVSAMAKAGYRGE